MRARHHRGLAHPNYTSPRYRLSDARKNAEATVECAMMTGSLTNRTVQLAFGSAVAILLVVGGLSYRSIVITRENNCWVQHTHEVLENLEELQFAMETVASSVRGYVLTGKENPISIATVPPD